MQPKPKAVDTSEVAVKNRPTNIATANQKGFAMGAARSHEAESYAGGALNPFVKMQQDGMWVMGADAEAVESDDIWQVHPGSIAIGFICWKEGSPAEECMRTIIDVNTEGPLLAADLTDHGPYSSEMDGWKPQSKLMLADASDLDDTNTMMLSYNISSKGGISAVQKIIDAIGERSAAGNPFWWPIVTLASSSYYNKKFRKDIFTPEFTIVGWSNETGDIENT